MQVVSYLCNSQTGSDTTAAVRARLDQREEAVEVIDVAAAEDPEAARRDAMLEVGTATRVGSKPDELFDQNGAPDFSIGVLITEAPTGRRELHLGPEALEVL